MKKIRTHYDNLQVVETASLEVIKGAYRYLSQKWHPDKNPHQREEATRILAILNCQVPCDHIPRSSYSLFRARGVCKQLIATIRAKAAETN